MENITIGSSEIASICGLNKYQTPFQLWCQKTGREAPIEETDQMWFGTKIEPVIAQVFEKKTCLEVSKFLGKYTHPDFGWWVVSPDFHVFENSEMGLLETKSVSFRSIRKWEDGQVPDYAHCQLQWQLGATGLNFGYVGALIGGDMREFVFKRFQRSDDVIGQMKDLAEKFIELVKTDTPPLVTDSDDIRKVFSEIKDEQKELAIEARDLFTAFDTLDDQISQDNSALEEKKKQRDSIKNQLAMMCGGAKIGLFENRKVEIIEQVRKEYVVKGSKFLKIKIS